MKQLSKVNVKKEDTLRMQEKVFNLCVFLYDSNYFATKFTSFFSDIMFNIFEYNKELRIQTDFGKENEEHGLRFNLIFENAIPKFKIDFYKKHFTRIQIEQSKQYAQLTIFQSLFSGKLNDADLKKASEILEHRSKQEIFNELQKKTIALENEIELRKIADEAFKQKQAQLMHTSRLTSLGEMASGVAHELNQPLAIIRAKVELFSIILRKHKDVKFPDKDNFVKSIFDQISRASKIIDHMRGFAYKGKANIEKVCINRPVEQSLIFIEEQFRNHNINIEIELGENLPVIELISQQIEQLIINLLSNARYAVEKKDENALAGYHKKVGIKTYFDPKNKMLCIEVSDNGIGMSETVKDRCLDPFFTTKDVNKGTGLGMSIIVDILKIINGVIDIESAVGEGTVIKISIPIT